MSQENVELARALHRAFNEGKIELVLTAFVGTTPIYRLH
jgi:hypothetical protein